MSEPNCIEILKPRSYEMVPLKDGYHYFNAPPQPISIIFGETASIKDGVFRCHVDPTDANALEFIRVVNSLLKSKGLAALTKIEPSTEDEQT